VADLRITPESSFRTKSLLVVSGPSGAGKSTFLECLRRGTLPAELAAALPSGAVDWPHTNGSRIRGGAGVVAGAGSDATVPGVAMHYDIMRIYETSIDDYRCDPALVAFDLADRITIVVIKPDPHLLLAQVQEKRVDRNWIGSALKAVERRIRRVLRPQKRDIYSAASGMRYLRLRDRYAEDGFLEWSYRRWEAFIEESVAAKLTRPTLVVEPTLSPEGTPCFTLIDQGLAPRVS
jgi:hypothetical protein